MAQYEFNSDSVPEALERFRELTVELNTAHEDLNAILTQWQDTVSEELRRYLASVAVDVGAAVNCADRIYLALEQIAEIYALAEHSAFDEKDYHSQKTLPPTIMAQPTTIKSVDTVLFGDLVLPDWLRAAVIKYEQSQLCSDERK